MLSTVAYATHRRRRSSSDVSRNISFLALGDSVASYHRYSLNPENSNSLTFTQTFLHNLSKISRWTLAYNFELESYRENSETGNIAARLNAPIDSMSYHKSGDEIKQKVKNSLIMEWKKFTAQVEANLIAAHNKVDYLRRDGLPVSLKYNKLLFDTKLYLELKYKKRNKLSFSYVVKSAMPYENDMLEVVDYTNPMSITTGNASLKAIITNTLSLRWTTKSINFDITFDKENNGVEHMMLYDPQTGVSVTRPENVGGTYSLSSNLRYLAQLGDFTFSAETDYSLDHSLLGSWTSMSSSQSNGYVDHHRARFDGQMKYGNSFCTQELGFRYAYNLIHRKGGFADNIRMTYTTGLASEFNLPMGFVLGSSVNWQSRHGDRVVSNEKSDLVIWNLSLARRFLKSKMLTVKVSANDMLHQRTNYQINYTDNGWSEQRNEGDAHYFMLSLVFHFNKM